MQSCTRTHTQPGELTYIGLPMRIQHETDQFPCMMFNNIRGTFANTQWKHSFLVPSPALKDGGSVGARADVGHDVGVVLTGDAECCVVGLAHSQEVGRWVAGHQLQHVRDERRGTEAERQDPWGEEAGS